jgi:hypothetical protein
MAFDPSTLMDASHLVTFLGGAAIGCSGQYLADRFTDQRRSKQAIAESKNQFSKLHQIMQKLMKEMAEDLRDDDTHTTREFVILSNRRQFFQTTVKRFVYFESEHPNVQNQVAMLEAAGYVQKVDFTNIGIYRMQETLVEKLK